MTLDRILEIGLAPASAAIGWFAALFVERRKKNNDFLTEMQANIDMLVEKYSATLKEVVELKTQNMELLTGQQTLESEIKLLRDQNSKLKLEVDKLTKLMKTAKNPKQ